MTTCTICGQQVTKKSTLNLRELGDTRDGRACRTHKEVARLSEMKQQEKILEIRLEKDSENMSFRLRFGRIIVDILKRCDRASGKLACEETLLKVLTRAGINRCEAGIIIQTVKNHGGHIMSESQIVDGLADGTLVIE